MISKSVQILPVVFALLAIGFGNFSQWCSVAGNPCFRTLIDRIIPDVTYPLYFFALYFLPIAIILIFVSRQVFNSWLKFAAWGVPLAILFIWATPVSSNALLAVVRDDAARLAGITFTVISLLFIAWKYFSLRKSTP